MQPSAGEQEATSAGPALPHSLPAPEGGPRGPGGQWEVGGEEGLSLATGRGAWPQGLRETVLEYLTAVAPVCLEDVCECSRVYRSVYKIGVCLCEDVFTCTSLCAQICECL